VFLYHRLPLSARPTFHYDLRAAIFMGVRFGVVELAALVAKKSLDAPDWQLAIITGAPIAALVLSVFWARLAAGSRKMPIVVGPQLISHALIAACAFGTGSAMFVISYCAATMVFCASMPASSAIYRLNYPPTHRATIIGFTRARMFIVSTLTSGLAGIILRGDDLAAKYLGWTVETEWLLGPGAYRSVFLAGAVFGLMATLSFGRIKVRGEKHEAVRSENPGFGRVLAILRTDSDFRLFLLSYFLGGFANIMCMPLLPIIIVDELDLSYDYAAYAIVTVPGLLMAVSSPGWGRILDRVNPMQARGWINLTWVFTPLLVAFGSFTGAPWPIYAGRALHGVLLGGSNIIWHLGVNFFAKKEDLPIYQGIHMTSTGIRGAIAPFLGVWLAHWSRERFGADVGGPKFVYLLAAGLLFLSAMTMFHLARRLRAEGRLGDFAQAEAAADGEEAGDSAENKTS